MKATKYFGTPLDVDITRARKYAIERTGGRGRIHNNKACTWLLVEDLTGDLMVRGHTLKLPHYVFHPQQHYATLPPADCRLIYAGCTFQNLHTGQLLSFPLQP